MKTKQYLRIMAVVLVALLASTSSSWAWNYHDLDYDEGGGRYEFYSENNSWGSGFYPWNLKAFRTVKSFNFDTDQLEWEYEFRVVNPNLNMGNVALEGEVYVVTRDDVSHKIATWSKTRDSKSNVVGKTTDNSYAIFKISKVDDGHSVKVQFLPKQRAFNDGVKYILFKSHILYKDSWDSGWVLYEKSIDLASVFGTDKPLPALSFDWDGEGDIVFQAVNVPNKKKHDVFWSLGYWVSKFFPSGYSIGGNINPLLLPEDCVITDHYNGKMDVTSTMKLTTSNMLSVYTMPIFIEFRGRYLIYTNSDKTEYEQYDQPSARGVIKPFTYPVTLNVEFDKWNKRNTITWTRQDSVQGYNWNKKYQNVECRLDGSWYVVRYEKDHPDDYVLLATIKGDEPTLQLTDDDLEYEKDYVYRVVFLPNLTNTKYKENLTGPLPGDANTYEKGVPLWKEILTSTRLDMPIRLAQDRTYENAVRLVWEYCIEPSGQNWTIEHSPVGENAWRTLDNSLSVDPDNSQASFDAAGTVCDLVDYRVKTTYAGKEFISNVITGNLPVGSYISEVKASTGTDETKVFLSWKVVRADINNDIYYRVLRRQIGVQEWTVLADDIHGTDSEYNYTDERVMAGSYYEYTVEAYAAKCDEQLVKTDAVITPGFSQARGTITGHIAYGTGTAATGVRVNLVKSSADESGTQPQFLSRYIEGEGKGLQWKADSAKYVNVLSGKSNLTLQLWAKPLTTASGASATQELLQLSGALELGVQSGSDGRFHLYAVDCSQGGTAITEFPELIFNDNDFTHVAATYSGGQWTFYVGCDTLLSATLTVGNTSWNTCQAGGGASLSVGGSNRVTGDAFKGFVDDIRLWNRALSLQELNNNYTRILGGTENGLFLYWPLDEGLNIRDYAFDVARQDGIYQLNHPVVGINAQPSATVPHAKYLALFGLTDTEGDYIIKGIPFQQGGTNYKLVPELGIHQFNPNSRSMFISPTSLTANNIDFEDVSSFPMRGYIYYAGTNIPAEGIQFYIDGGLVTSDGKITTTDENGEYQISVPIGKHYVEAKLDGHTMVDGGRFPTSGTFNFDRAMQYDFADSTLVNFVGRISGGVRNDTLAVGFGASNNNIGKAKITLKLNNETSSFNCLDDHNTDATTQRTWDSDTISIKSRAWTGTDYDAKYIYIVTDPLTGEFSAKIPPLKYVTKSISLENNLDGIEFTTLPEIDLTNVGKELTDSLKQPVENSDSVWNFYKYNTKMVQTHLAKPEVTLWQFGGDGAFGEREMKNYAVSNTEKVDIKDIWTRKADGSIDYTYDFPVFARKKEYKFGVHGFEVYNNYDSGVAVADTIPLNGQVLSVANEMSDKQDVVARVIDASVTELKEGSIYNLKINQVRLDEEGKNEITFTTGLPNVVAPYTRQFGMTFERNKRTYVGPSVNGVVLGELTNGNNFVTDGPDHVDMVLRDPPGAKGKTTWKSGTSYTKIDCESNGIFFDETLAFDLIWGAKLETAVGFGVAIISGSNATTTMVAGEKGSFSWTWDDKSTYVYTTAESISTSTGNKYVGASGDVFIGKSHNFIIGTCNKLGFHREADGIKLGLKEAVSVNDSIKTDFVYSAYEIENTMIPKILDTRNALLEYKDSISAVNYQNTTTKDVYLTWLKPEDARYGSEKTYVWKPGIRGRSQDLVLHYNESVRLWRERLAENEKDKIEARQNQDYFKENRSFDGGTSYTYLERRDTTKTSTFQKYAKVGYVYEVKTEFTLNTTATFGTNFNFKSEGGYVGSRLTGDSLDNKSSYIEFDYDLNDGNPGTDFSVDIYHSPRGWSDIFLLRGGQSYNPYEGEERTKYYEEGQHIISYGTEQMEQPVIRISTDGNVSAKSATLTDVPAGQTGQFTLHLTNNTQTNQDIPFLYTLQVQEYVDSLGLEVMMDGFPVSGRSIYIPAGETIKKVITVRQSDQSVLDYENIEILFCSQYQPIKISDSVTFSVHFKPSSSAIQMVVNDPVLNIETMDRSKGNLEMKVTNFDRQFKGMKKVGVEYRFEGSTSWTQPSELTFYVNAEDTTGTGAKLLPTTGDLRLTLDMSNNNYYPQGNYTFRAYTTTMYDRDPVNVYSSEVTVVKDNLRPRNLTTPEPANGILRYGDDICIEFNEDIVPGYVSDKNVIVTAKLNNQPIKHDVALQLIPYGVSACTINPLFLNGDFSIEFWMKWTQGGYLFRWGKSLTLMSMGIDNDGYVKISIGGSSYVSKDALPKDTWTYVVISFSASDLMFSSLARYDDRSVELFVNQPVTFSDVESINYADNYILYLGCGITGAIHDLALYNIYRDVHDVSENRYVSKDQYVYGLTNYWPMNEGHGTLAADSRHTHDFEVPDRWELSNVNYSYNTASFGGLTANIENINTLPGDSYAIELWATSYSGSGTLFEAGSVDSNKLCLRYNDDNDLVLDYGLKSQVVVNHNDFPNYGSWHHLALNVVRGQAASFYYDGQRTAVIAEVDMPMLEGSKMNVGMEHNGKVDELRIWHATLTEDQLLKNIYNCIDTTDIYSRGLVAYYPFEKLETVNGIPTYVGTLENMAPLKYEPSHTATANQSALSPYGPPVKKALVESRLIAKPVASERKIVIKLQEDSGIKMRDIEGTTLNITVDKIHDMHGNQSNPIRWTAYVQQNTLKWTKDSVNVFKKYGDDYTFDVNIENRGGNTEYYTLYNMPQWLTLVNSERTDDVSPLSTKTLRFQVNSLVAVGNYDVTIGLQGNNEILEPLRIVMQVRGVKPAWSVDPNAYENTMSVVGQIYVNGVLMGNSESLLAAFIGDECRGIASPKQIRDAAYVAMSVYGTAQQNVNGVATDLDKGQPVTFRIWDAVTGMIYTNVAIVQPDSAVTDALTFDPTVNYGTFDHPLIFTKSNLVEQPLNIKAGWNWLSFGVEPSQTKTSVVFRDLVSWNAQLKDKTTGVAYSRGNYWAGNLKEVHANTMYKLQLTRLETSNDLPQPFVINGEQVKLSETPVTLHKDWNWMPYLPMTTLPIDMALAGANPKKGDQVKSQTAFAYYASYGWEGNLEALESGKGYLYHSLDTVKEKQFVYPTVSAATARSLHSEKVSSRNRVASAFSPVEPTDYPDNMAVVIMLTDSGTPITDAEVAAFVDGECRGTAFADDDLYYLLVAGEGSGQPMEIRANIGGTIQTVCTKLTYASDGSIGTPWEPLVIDINDPSGINTVYGPMVDGVWYTLQGIRYGTSRPTASGVYLYNGQKVVIKKKAYESR